jgi:hypothetical protein
VSSDAERLKYKGAELATKLVRLRECNRLLILELEDTRTRVSSAHQALDERQRRQAAAESAAADTTRECSRLRAEVEALEEQVETLKQRQMDIEREAEVLAELLLQAEAEGAAHLSAHALVKEALANKSDGAVSATARVRDALAHHLKAGGAAPAPAPASYLGSLPTTPGAHNKVAHTSTGKPALRAGKCVLPPVEETPEKAPDTRHARIQLSAPEDSFSSSQFEKLLNRCASGSASWSSTGAAAAAVHRGEDGQRSEQDRDLDYVRAEEHHDNLQRAEEHHDNLQQGHEQEQQARGGWEEEDEEDENDEEEEAAHAIFSTSAHEMLHASTPAHGPLRNWGAHLEAARATAPHARVSAQREFAPARSSCGSGDSPSPEPAWCESAGFSSLPSAVKPKSALLNRRNAASNV